MLLTSIVNLFFRVPYVPSRKKIVNHIIKLANLKNGEKIYDLGCGDGRFLFEAERQAKIEATGFEAAPIPYLLAHFKKWISGSRVQILMRNFFHADLKDADVIFCYLGPETMTALAEKFKKECRRGTRIYSHTFSISSMKPYQTWPKNSATKLPTIYLYKV
jgi:cyclopropane fatty-acyl-phospholipid synthase-like methyltransferase